MLVPPAMPTVADSTESAMGAGSKFLVSRVSLPVGAGHTAPAGIEFGKFGVPADSVTVSMVVVGPSTVGVLGDLAFSSPLSIPPQLLCDGNSGTV